jgi:glycosyltransferase involved in cell wall biosynthesis
LNKSRRFHSGVVVDDGSGGHSKAIFRQVSALPEVTLLRHPVNLGKGAALKTGLDFISTRFPRVAGIVTADADGQHETDDILRVCRACADQPQALILGSRDFGADVPIRNRLGNRVTSWLMHRITGYRLKDTQTGLRGLPMDQIGWMSNIPADGYDFEMDLLLSSLARNVSVVEVDIHTVYLDHNQSSHFNPLMDSWRIYTIIFRHAAGWRRNPALLGGDRHNRKGRSS